MTEKNVSSLDSVCRACLENSTDMYSLTETISNLELSIASMLEFCTSTKLVLKEDLPNNVCLPCYKSIRISYQFFKRFEEVQQQLLSLKDTDSISDEETLLFEVETSLHEGEDLILQKDSDSDSEVNNKIEYIPEDTEQTNFSQIIELQGINSLDSKIEFIVDETKNESKEKRNRYICPICGEKFIRQDMFESHIKQYKLEKITCTRCPSRPEYDTHAYLYHHRHFHKYHCDICDKRLVSSYGYYYHRKQHENIKLYKCCFKDCSKSFTMKHLLTKHKNIHHSSKVYNCQLCCATFNTNDSLRYHLKVHNNKKDHLCTTCGKAFFQAVHLRDHMYRHLGYKKFVCDLCGKSFVTNSSLKKHFMYCARKNANVHHK